MKKIFALLLALSMILALAACGGQSNPAPAQDDGGKTQDNAQEPAPAPAPGNDKLVVGFAQIGNTP